ncbi:MAG: hypothetical protein AB8G22_03180 [Saprospiraceae bacterium]
MAKSKKTTRDYSKYFNKPATDLPLPEEVNEKVVEINQPKAKPEPVAKPIPSPPASTQVIHQQPVEPEIVSKRGRKPLEEPKVPYTTALTNDHKLKLKMEAVKRGLRPSDMLHEILAAYFADLEG